MARQASERPELELREIAAIDAVARTRSFKIAADCLNTTQPTLSRLIASAEAALGTALFRRGWSGAETTSAGDVAARSCAAMIATIETAERQIFASRKSHPRLHLNLKNAHLAAIAAVTRDGSVTLAAQRIARSQPDLSRMLSEFAKRFDLVLFQRSATGMLPLEPAQALTALAGSLAYQLDRLAEQLHRLEGEILGRVSVGMLPFSGQDLIAVAFARLTNQHPNIQLSCVPGSYNTLIEALRRREIDRIIGILRGPGSPPGLDETHLYDERFAVIARRGHPLLTAGPSPESLAATNWVVAPHGTPVRSHFEAVFAALDLTPPTQTCEMISFSAAEQMLVESASVAMLTYSDRKLRNLRPELQEVRTGFAPVPAPIGITRLEGEREDAALLAFDRILRDLVAEVHPPG